VGLSPSANRSGFNPTKNKFQALNIVQILKPVQDDKIKLILNIENKKTKQQNKIKSNKLLKLKHKT